MKTFVVLALLVVAAVSAMPQKKSFAERVQASFEKWLITEKRAVIYPPGFEQNKDKCDGNDCCKSNSCAHGSCIDESNAGTDTLVSKFGYQCIGKECGSNEDQSKPEQYAGLFCDVPSFSACENCEKKHGKYDLCYAATTSLSGYMCTKMKDGDYLVQDRRELDVLYGEGTASQFEQIAKEEAEAEVQDKQSLTSLLRELINELDDNEEQ